MVNSRTVLEIALAMMMMMLTVQVSLASVAALPTLSISKMGPSRINWSYNAYATYTIIVTNTGTSSATNVVVTDFIPTGMSYISSSMPVTTILPKEVTWNLGTIMPGTTMQISLVLRGNVVGSWTDTATVTSAEGVTAQASATTYVAAIF